MERSLLREKGFTLTYLHIIRVGNLLIHLLRAYFANPRSLCRFLGGKLLERLNGEFYQNDI